MSKQRVFDFDHYKSYLSYCIQGKENRGQLSVLADAAGCQRPYLSRVLSTEIHLTPDHAFGLTQHWQFDNDESEYFMTLVEWERAARPKYRQALKAKLTKIRKKYDELSARTDRNAEVTADPTLFRYYTSWHFSAIHILTSIPEFQSEQKIAVRLALSLDLVKGALDYLASLGFVVFKNNRWYYQTGEKFLSRTALHLPAFHQHWRGRAVLDAFSSESDGIHFSNVQSLSQHDFQKLKRMLTDFIEECMAVAGPSDTEEAVVFTFDLFPV